MGDSLQGLGPGSLLGSGYVVTRPRAHAPDLLDQIRLAQRGLLAMTVEEIEQLCLQRRAGTVGVEIREERILHFLQHDRGVESRAETLGQRGFPRADRSFDRDVAELQGGPMISS